MKSKVSYFSISIPLIKENLRRFWAIPALAFLTYFLAGVFPILMAYGHLNDWASYINVSLRNQNPFFSFAHLLFPIIAAVVVFRYMQGSASVSVMHAMPFNRMKLFHSNFLSGLILITVPILANGLLLLLMSKPVYDEYSIGKMGDFNYFSNAEVFNWIWVSLLIVAFIYTVSVFAGLITGNALLHLPAALWFNFLLPALYLACTVYSLHFLYGFSLLSNWRAIGMKMSPLLYVFSRSGDGHFDPYLTTTYLLCIVLLYALAALLYQKRALERATDALAFGFMEPVTCYLLTFLSTTLLAFYLNTLDDSNAYLYSGFLIGSVVFFIIGQMIVKKTPRIYHLQSLKNFGIYVLIFAIFISGLRVDFTGFEKRIPDQEKVQNFTLIHRYDSYYNSYSNLFRPILQFKEPSNIEAMINIHQMLIENKERLSDLENVKCFTAHLIYNPEGKRPLQRSYEIDYETFRNSPDFKTIHESKEYKDYYTPSNLGYEELSTITISTDHPGTKLIRLANPAELEEFIACLDKDFQQQSFEDSISFLHRYASANIVFHTKGIYTADPDELSYDSVDIEIKMGDTHTINWLQAKGYGTQLAYNLADIDYIELCHVNDANAQVYYSEGRFKFYHDSDNVPEVMKITDPGKIQEIFDSYETELVNYNDYYYGIVVYKGDIFSAAADDWRYERDTREEIPATTDIYFNQGSVPAYIQQYFN